MAKKKDQETPVLNASATTGTATAGTEKQAKQVKPEDKVGRTGPIGEEQVQEATTKLEKYKEGKTNLESRIVENEKWWKMQQGDDMTDTTMTESDTDRPSSAWLWNSIANKHADAMDNYPEPCILPRAKDDVETAEKLSAIVPVVLQINDHKQVYNDVWWYKLIKGTGVTGVFWNQSKCNGYGDIDLKKIDLLNLFWLPGVTNIQDSPNLFNVELVEKDYLEERYPDLADKLGSGSSIEVAEYSYDDSIDTTDKVKVVDWYYKKLNEDGKQVLHYCKYVGTTVLYASENDPDYAETGYYAHGKYPYIFDVLYPCEGTPAGRGLVDIMKNCQTYINILDQAILENSIAKAKRRWLVSDSGGINEEELLDFGKPVVHAEGSLDERHFMEITYDTLPTNVPAVLQMKIDELKETSGNRDFSQGSTSSGVTAASAIQSLMEAGSKLSRDMISSSYRAFEELTHMVIDLIEQFYDTPRSFRITGETAERMGLINQQQSPMQMNAGQGIAQQNPITPQQQTQPYGFVDFDNSGLVPQDQGTAFGVELGYRTPVFDVEVAASKKSAYSRMSQNELALQFFQLGFFNPQMSDQALCTLQMMDFDNKNRVMELIRQNKGMYENMKAMQNQMMNQQGEMAKMGMVIDAQNGTNLTQGIAEEAGNLAQQAKEMEPGKAKKTDVKSTSTSTKAAQTARESAAVK